MITQEQISDAKILIVDDQKLHIRLLENILRSGGYKNITSTTDPRKAVAIYEEFNPDLILLDLVMPHIDGFGIMEQLKSNRQEEYLPILVLSGQEGQEMRMRALKEGATDFVHIPYESAEVLVRIRSLLQARILHMQVSKQNKILEAKVRERTKELNDTRLEIIRRLAHAAEYRDTDTGIHIIRMSRFCAKLGRAAGMNETQCDLLLNASPLHDVGKIGIPDSILLKPDRLTDDEFEIMKTHAAIGSELLSGSDSPFMKMAQTIALTHHEKWDGTGYPRKLKGGDIPLAGRICGLCDVFDALTSKRPYKKAWSVNEAMKEILGQSGKHFDPHLVKVFSAILPEIEAIKDQYVE